MGFSQNKRVGRRSTQRSIGVAICSFFALFFWVGCQKKCTRVSEQTPVQVVLRGQQVDTRDSHWKEKLHGIVERFLDEKVEVQVGARMETTTYRQLGFYVNESLLIEKIQTAKQSLPTLLFPVEIDAPRARAQLQQLKARYDLPILTEVIDLQQRKIWPPSAGFVMNLWESLLDLQDRAHALQDPNAKVEHILSLTGSAQNPPQGRRLADGDINEVLGSYQTKYAPERDRTFNLTLGSDKLNKTVIFPGEVFSFNDTVGPRTIENGYRVAAGYREGEIVDDVGGGACQLASTLHAAAFFAGLDFVKYTPHSRPSAYIPMGLDATVVYDSKVDLQIRNPYDFPVVIHIDIKEGLATAKIYGRKRVARVIFEREVLDQEMPDGSRAKEKPFPIEVRLDPSVPETQTPLFGEVAPVLPSAEPEKNKKGVLAEKKNKQPSCIAELPSGEKRFCLLDQAGHPGYKVRVRRYTFQGDPPIGVKPFLRFELQPDLPPILEFFGEVKFGQGNEGAAILKTLDRTIVYPPTKEVKRVGTGSPKLKPAPIPNIHPIHPIRTIEKTGLSHLVQ